MPVVQVFIHRCLCLQETLLQLRYCQVNQFEGINCDPIQALWTESLDRDSLPSRKEGKHALQGSSQEETVVYDSAWLLTPFSQWPLLCCRLKDQTDTAPHTLLPVQGRPVFIVPKHAAQNTSDSILRCELQCVY